MNGDGRSPYGSANGSGAADVPEGNISNEVDRRDQTWVNG